MPNINVRWSDNTEQLKQNLQRGTTQLEATRASVDKLVKAFAGENLIAAAHKWAVAIEQIGGATKLSAAEQQRANAIFEKAAEKLQLLGRGGEYAAQQFRLLAAETKKVDVPGPSALNKWVGELGTGIASTAAGFISAQAVMGAASGAWRTLTTFVSDSVKSYADAEAAQVKLTAALRSQGTATPAIIDQYNALSTEFERTTVFSDDLITSMQALLVEVGSVMPSQMKCAIQASADLASGLGIDLETATTLVAKAAAGHTETLGKYGITVDDAKLKTDGFSAVLEAINRQFGGQAAAQVETYAGQVQQLANQWDNVKEAVGEVIATNPTLQSGLRLLVEIVGDLKDTAEGAGGAFSRLLDISGFSSIATYVALIDGWAKSANNAADAMERLKNADVKPVASHLENFPPSQSHDTDAERIEKDAKAAAARKAQQAKDDKAAEDAQKKLTEALAAFGVTLKSVAATQDSYAQTVDKIDGKTVEGIKYYLQRGRSVHDLAVAYGLLDVEVQAVSEQMKFEQSVIDSTNKLFGKMVAVVPQVASASRALTNVLVGLTEDGLLPADDTLTKFNRHLLNLKDIGHGPSGTIDAVDDSAKKATTGLSDLAQAFSQLAQVSGDKFGGVAQGIGQVITAIDVAQKAVKTLDDAVEAGTQNWSNYATAGAGAFAAVLTGATILISFLERNVAEEDRNFQHWSDTTLELNRRINALRDAGLSWDQVRIVQEMNDALFAMGKNAQDGTYEIDQLAAAIDAMVDHLEDLQSGARQFGLSEKERVDAERRAHEIFDFMLAEGTYTQEALNKAYMAWQRALAEAGNAAAAAWVKAHDEAAKAATEATKALDDLISKRDALMKTYENEAPEKEMGDVEKAARAAVDAMNDQIAEIQKHAEETAKAAEDAAKAGGDGADDAAKKGKKSFSDLEEEALRVKGELEEAFRTLAFTIPVHFAVDPVPTGGGGGGQRERYAATGGIVTNGGIEPWGMPALSGPRGTDRVPVWLTEGETVRTARQEAALQGGGETHNHFTIHAVDVKSFEDLLRRGGAQALVNVIDANAGGTRTKFKDSLGVA